MAPLDWWDTPIDKLQTFINIGNNIYHHRCRQKMENTISFYMRVRFFIAKINGFQTAVLSYGLSNQCASG